MELDARQRAGLDRGHERSVVLDLGDADWANRLDREAMGEVDVGAVEAVEKLGRTRERKRVPAHVGHPARADAAHLSLEQAQPGAALLALLEQELHADADPEQRST